MHVVTSVLRAKHKRLDKRLHHRTTALPVSRRRRRDARVAIRHRKPAIGHPPRTARVSPRRCHRCGERKHAPHQDMDAPAARVLGGELYNRRNRPARVTEERHGSDNRGHRIAVGAINGHGRRVGPRDRAIVRERRARLIKAVKELRTR